MKEEEEEKEEGQWECDHSKVLLPKEENLRE